MPIRVKDERDEIVSNEDPEDEEDEEEEEEEEASGTQPVVGLQHYIQSLL